MNRILIASALGALAFSSVGLAQAADLIVSQPPASSGYVQAPASGNWDGVYLGAFGGYGWATLTDSDNYLGGGTDATYDLEGWLAGVNVGANFTLTDGIVAGVVGDIAWSDISGSYDGQDYSIDWLGSVRGKLGFDAGAFMPYFTGGAAFAGVNLDDNKATHLGWTVGAGVDVALSENMNFTAEYRYSDYGSAEHDGYDVGLRSSTVTAGISFKF